ncbi:MAG TPA: c-type cytochrome [Chitinophagales bacterium]|nr:c-type cytochrome [Chitinophagales bacterium]HNM32595.1 c-type cytochrome [Chitinophagales bacterium]
MKKHSKKISILLLLAFSIIFMSFRTVAEQKEEHEKFTNLKVLSKKISHDDLIAVMKGYCAALNVKCSFCHVKNGEEFDFASDDIKEKEITRKMQKMANGINKKYFGKNSGTVGCMTCHHGKKNPNDI